MHSPLPQSLPRPRVSVVIPAHNEEQNLPRVLEAVVEALEAYESTRNYEIVVVNDNSRDRTGAVAEEYGGVNPRIRVVHRTESPGFGNAIRSGLAAARGEAMVPFMGDLSDDPHAIARMREKIDEGYDVVYGSRFVKGGETSGYPRGKWIANRLFNNVVRALFGIKFRDFTNAFKMYRREVIDAVGVETLESAHFDLTIELPLRAHLLGFRATEIPVPWFGRQKGEAKFKVKTMGLRYGRRLLRIFFVGGGIAIAELFRTMISGSKWRLAGGAAMGAVLLVSLAFLFGGTEPIARVASASVPYVAAAALASLAALFLRVWRWMILLRGADRPVPQQSAYRCIMFGWFLNYLLPLRMGDVGRGFGLKAASGVEVGTSLATIGVERILDLGVLVALLGAGILLSATASGTVLYDVVTLSVLLIAIFLVGIFATTFYNGFLSGSFPRLDAFLVHARDTLRNLGRSPAHLSLALLFSVVVWITETSTVYFSAKALGITLSTSQVVLVGSAAFLAQSLPATPAGLGLHEGAIAGVLVTYGADPATGFAVGLVDHVARGAIVYVLGGIATVHLAFQSRQYFRAQSLSRAQSGGAG